MKEPTVDAGESATATGGNGAAEPAAERGALPSMLEAVTAERDRLLEEKNELVELLRRRQAEFENFRKRNAKAQEEYREYALADALKALLPILDSLDNALKTNAASLEDFHSGIELNDKQFHDALAKLGVQPISTEGKPFDPNLHQAIQLVDTGEAEDNHVLDELQRGYKLKDRLLRPAMVRVARNPKN